MLTKAILLVNQSVTQPKDGQAHPGCLDLLVDRPWLHHVIEQIAHGGIRHIDVVADAGADEIAREISGGERWGVSIRLHRVGTSGPGPDALSHLHEEPDILLADARALVSAESWSGGREDGAALEAYHHPRSTRGALHLEWTGWARGRGDVLAGAVATQSAEDLIATIQRLAGSVATTVCTALCVSNAQQLIDANQMVISGRAPYVSLRGRAHERGIWRERGVRVHPTARLIEPVYLGEHAMIGRGAVVGPNAVVGAGALVDQDAVARDCVISTATYIPMGARLHRVVGLRQGGYRHASGEAVQGPLAAALLDLRQFSIASEAWPRLAEWISRIVSPVLIAREGLSQLARALYRRAPALAVIASEDNTDAALSH